MHMISEIWLVCCSASEKLTSLSIAAWRHIRGRLLKSRAPVDYDSWLGCRLCFHLMCALTWLKGSTDSLTSGFRHCSFGVVLNMWLWVYATVNLGKKIECRTMGDPDSLVWVSTMVSMQMFLNEGCWLCRF